jgi:glycosyltransferase involved in cell wall biosynthesis
MKILQISSTFLPVIGGTENVVFETCRELGKEGHEVTVITTDLYYKDQEFIKEETIDGIKVLRFHNKKFLGGYGYAPEVIKWLKENCMDYDIAHCQGFNRYTSEFALKYLAGKIPTIFTPHGFIHTKKNMMAKRIHDVIMKRVIQKADFCTMLTQLDKKDYERLGVEKKRLVEIPNGVNTKKYTNVSKTESENFKRKYNIKDNTILTVGRVHKSKGIQYILDAIKDLDCNLLVVGPDGGYKEELEKQIEEYSIRERIIFTGPVSNEELVAAYNVADIFVLASEWEGFGLVAIEAMASGTPVITSNRGALPYLINNNKNGFLIEYKDIEQLKNKIKYLLSNKVKQKNFITEGKKTAQKYDWKSIIKLNINMYKEAMKKYGK